LRLDRGTTPIIVRPSPPSAERPKTPQAVFDRVAPFYDVLNSVLSFGMDRKWRRETVAALKLSPGASVLDVATGTGALAIEIARATSGTVQVTACDTNERMLSVARARNDPAMSAVEIVRCDATKLPFADQTFDAVTVSFAIDDMPDRVACVREIRRVLRNGGSVALLELSQPDHGLLRTGYLAYLRVFRAFGRLGYEHLEEEILKYRGPEAVEELLRGAGFDAYRRRSLSGGIARVHLADKGHGVS
jgi:demethylmenaquinone methyltransferase/2-methoxy-6-polyprenyl-1,4-benzoquinol methylase